MYDFSDLVGKPFEYGGRGPDTYDCYGLVREVFERVGKQMPDVVSPTKYEMIHCAGEELKKQVAEEINEPEPFCIVGFIIRPPYTSHMGIVLEDGFRFIHVLENTQVCIERLDNGTWSNRISGFYRVTECKN